MKKLFKKAIIALSIAAIAGSVFAQLNAPIVAPTNGGSNASVGTSLQNIVVSFKNISTGVYSSLFVVALIAFFIGIINLLRPGNDASGKADAYKFLGFGIVALFVMVGVWGLVSFLSANLGIGVGGDIPTPGVPNGVRTY